MASSCLALQVPDVGHHVLPFLAEISLMQRNTYIHVNTPGILDCFRSRLVSARSCNVTAASQ